MGILNVTPDSFSDGGRFTSVAAAFKQATAMLAAGALVIDIGGESSRPGAEPISTQDELARVLPIIKRLSDETEVLISIDTSKAEVAAAALQAGAHLVNDISGLRQAEMLAICAQEAVPAVIMHMQGEPRSMQQNPTYQDVSGEVFGFLERQANLALNAGLPSVMLDPGIGFGKSLEHNLQLIRELDQLVSKGYPVLLGASRKRLIDMIANVPEGTQRDPGALALHLYGLDQGAAMLRVHNVPAHNQAVKVWTALRG